MPDEVPRLEVVGTGTVQAAPDLLRVTVTVEARAGEARAAWEAATAAQRRVLDAVRAAGVRDADVRTVGLSLAQEFDYDRGRRLLGFLAGGSVVLSLADVAAAGEVIGAAVAAGGDAVRLDGTALEVTDPDGRVAGAARERAVADARARAETLAAAAGTSLGRLLLVSDAVERPAPVFGGVELAARDMAVAPGLMAVTAVVRMVWALDG